VIFAISSVLVVVGAFIAMTFGSSPHWVSFDVVGLAMLVLGGFGFVASGVRPFEEPGEIPRQPEARTVPSSQTYRHAA
jgi:hypothetical protein